MPDCTSSAISSDAVTAGDVAQPLEEDVRRNEVAAFALDRLDEDRRDFVRRHEMDEQLLLDEAQTLGRARIGRRARDSDRQSGYGA